MYTPKGKKIKIDPSKDPSVDLVSSQTGLPYEGPYIHNTATDTYTDLTGVIILDRVTQDPSIDVDEHSIAPTRYDRLIKDTAVYKMRSTRALPTHTPQPTQQDYDAGAFYRYFAQHKETGTVIEIEKNVHSLLKAGSSKFHYPSYKTGVILWRLNGPVANQDVNGYIIKGTAQLNVEALLELEKKLPNIRTYLTDPSQFVK